MNRVKNFENFTEKNVMPYPKLSAALNNCGLHGLTPEIKAQVLLYAHNSEYDNGHTEAYGHLKDCFANYYGLKKESFSWKDFASILSCYNSFDTQLILGPVLREFMRLNLPPEEITKHVEIQSPENRYSSLELPFVRRYVGKPLGIGLNENSIQNGPTGIVTFSDEKDFTRINLHHLGGAEGAGQGGHWERTRNASELNKDQENSQLVCFTSLLTAPETTLAGINLLKKHVSLTSQSLKEGKESNVKFSELDLSARQIERLSSSLNIYDKGWSAALLGSDLTPDAQLFLENSPESEQASNPSTEVYQIPEVPVIPKEPSIITQRAHGESLLEELLEAIQTIHGNFASRTTVAEVDAHYHTLQSQLGSLDSFIQDNQTLKIAIEKQQENLFAQAQVQKQYLELFPIFFEKLNEQRNSQTDSTAKSAINDIITDLTASQVQLISGTIEISEEALEEFTGEARKTIKKLRTIPGLEPFCEEWEKRFSPIQTEPADSLSAEVPRADQSPIQEQPAAPLPTEPPLSTTHKGPPPPPTLGRKGAPPPPQAQIKKEKLLALKAKFESLLGEFENDIIQNLKEKSEKDPEKYKNVLEKAMQLQTLLNDEKEALFANPTTTTLYKFETNCRPAIKEAKIEFKKHRDLWNQEHPLMRIIKGLLGVLAAVTILPGLATAATKRGYLNTFFHTPKTETAQRFKPFEDKYKAQEEALKDIITPPVTKSS